MAHAFTEQLIQAVAVVAHTPPASQTSGVVVISSPVDMLFFKRALLLMDNGVITSGTYVVQWFVANNVAFTTAGTIASGLTTTNTTTSMNTTTMIVGTSGATRVEKFEIRSDQMPAGFRWAQPQITVSSAQVPLFGAIIIGMDPDYLPANQAESTGFAAGTTGSAIVDQAVAV